MVEAYTELGLTELAADANEVLSLNYPDYQRRTFKEARSTLLHTATFGLMGEAEEPAVPARPTRSLGETKAEATAEKEAQEAERSWFHKATFGIFE